MAVNETGSRRVHSILRTGAAAGKFLLARGGDIFIENALVVVENGRLFVGITLFSIGLLSIESDRYCDGNTAAYLSCTRPSTYYYWSAFDIFFIIAGVFLIVLWFMMRPSKR